MTPPYDQLVNFLANEQNVTKLFPLRQTDIVLFPQGFQVIFLPLICQVFQMPHRKTCFTALVQKAHHIFRHVRKYQFSTLVQQSGSFRQRSAHFATDVKAALTDDSVKEAILSGSFQILTPLHILASGL